MRKIEQDMIEAIRSGEDFKRDNTRVEHREGSDGNYALVYLHGNLISESDKDKGRLVICDAGWQSVTTKSRLNALLSELVPGFWGIVQRDWIWHLQEHHQGEVLESHEWEGVATLVSGKVEK